MTNENNIYHKARTRAHITQNKAAEIIQVSIDSIRAYEGGKRVPQDETVIKMAKAYNSLYLAYEHLEVNSKIAKMIVPHVELTTLPMAVLKLLKSIYDFMDNRDLLIEIGASDIENPEQLEKFEIVMNQLNLILEAILNLKLIKV